MKVLQKLLTWIIDLIDPYLQVSAEYQVSLRQKEHAFISKVIYVVPLTFIFIFLNALLFNDSGKTNYVEWLRYRIAVIIACVATLVIGLAARRSILKLKLLLVLFSYAIMGAMAFGMTLGYSFRSQWMSYFSAPILALTLRSPLIAASLVATGLFIYRPIWSHFHETRLVMTEYEFTCFFILLAYFWRRLWISKVISDISLRLAENRTIMQAQELHSQLRTFVPPILVKRIEELHSTGSSIASALDSVLRLRKTKISVLYSDLRDYSRRSDDISFIEKILVPSASKIIDHVEANEAIARIIGDGIFCFYSADDPEESLLRAIRDAWMCAETEFYYSKTASSTFSRHLTVTYGDAYLGNIGSRLHKDTSVIGKPANLAARIDDLTKRESIKKWIGYRSHILISKDAKDTLLSIIPKIVVESFDLKEKNIEIRSYEKEEEIYLIPCIEENEILVAKILGINGLPPLKRGAKVW